MLHEGASSPSCSTSTRNTKTIKIIPLSDKYPPPAHTRNTGRNATSGHLLEVGSLECVLSEAGVPGLTSTYSGGWNDYSNYSSPIGLDRMP